MRLIVPALLLALALAAPAAADEQYRWGETPAPIVNPAMSSFPAPAVENGPCTEAAARAMPASPEHGDHLDVTRHNFACRMSKVFFDPLTDVLSVRPDIVLGEMDVKGNLMVIAAAFPESGFLLYDISNPAQPKLLSHYRGEECEDVYTDVDCGAYVDLSPSGKRVYISVQAIAPVHSPNPSMRPVNAYPGVEVVDISNPTLPVLLQTMPVVSVGGVHTTRSFVVPETGGAGDREPGEYTVSVANSMGLMIHRVTPAGLLAPVTLMEVGETHDTFIHEDPILNRTLLYAAGGFTTGFYVWDITAPSSPVLLGEWDPTPECGADWYSHTIDVTVKNGRRVVTLPNELIDFFGEQGDDPENCGTLQGNGDHAGPMWFIDATDFSKLGPASTGAKTDAESTALKDASLKTLITYYANPARRAGGELTFSPHNQQIVGDKVYLSQYHGGVVVLDAKAAFEGRNVQPKETALYVPHEGPTRPIHPDAGDFFTSFIDYRPLIWDMTYVNGHVMIPDMTGGLTVAREDDSPGAGPTPNPPSPPACADRSRPTASLERVRLTRRSVRLGGRAADRGCAGVSRVSVAIGRRVGRKCSFLSRTGRFTKARSCRKPVFLNAKGRRGWSYSRKAKLRRGRYVVLVRASDAAGNRGKAATKRGRVR
ncbi:MAG TPA: hypothetical protein VM266_10920 [Solirubrobacteraceae bacterium]|nr:hypothetical protein [Solirubrobacteraceae bacterium]